MNFESIFKDKISEYIKKIFDKTKNVKNIKPIIELININEIPNNNFCLEFLNKKYDSIFSSEIESLSGKELKEEANVTDKLHL